MEGKGYPVELHKRAFLLWASGLSYDRISLLPGYPSRETIISWSQGKCSCTCPWHRWRKLREKLSGEELDQLLREENIDLGEVMSKLEQPETSRALDNFINSHREELRPVFRKIKEFWGIRKANGRLTGNLHVDMLITGYLLVLKVREAVVNIQIDDAYQLIQLMRTVVQIFKEWGIPSQPMRKVEEMVEIKLVDAEKPTPWKEKDLDQEPTEPEH